MILLDAFSLSTSLGNWAIGILVTAIMYFLFNRAGKVMEKIDLVAEFVVSQLAKNGHYDREIENIRKEQEKLEKELTGKFDRMDGKLDEFMREVRKERLH